MRIRYKFKDAIAEIAKSVVAIYCKSKGIESDYAAALGGLASGFVKGWDFGPKEITLQERMLQVIRGTMSKELSYKKYGLTENCREALLDATFTPGNAAKYLQANDPEKMLRDTMQKILAEMECYKTQAALRPMAKAITEKTAKAIRDDPQLIVLKNHYDIQYLKETAKKTYETTQETNANVKILVDRHENNYAGQPALNLRGPGPAIKLIGRDADMAVFDSEILTRSKICVVSGIGGVGKTEFVKAFVNERKGVFNSVGWFNYENSFRDTLLGTQGLVSNSRMAANDPDGRYGEILSFLGQLKENDLLVFDNVSEIESEEDLEAVLTLPCKVIFTTRDTFTEERNRLFVYDMEFLNEEGCEALFANYRREETPEAERENLCEVIRLAGQHTLVLELMAKSCEAAGLSVGKLLERLNKDGFNLAGLRETVRREGGKKRRPAAGSCAPAV